MIMVMTLITWLHWPVTEVQVYAAGRYIFSDFDVFDHFDNDYGDAASNKHCEHSLYVGVDDFDDHF